MQHLSLLTAGWSYIPAGLTFGYLVVLPIPFHQVFVNIYHETMYWPFLVAIITLLISVAVTNGLKLNYRKCQFVHLYVMLAAMVLYLGAGLVFLLVKDVVPAIYLGACGLGLTLIPGLSYTHIRAPGRWRSVYMGCCYFWFLAGVAATATLFLNDVLIWWPNEGPVNETIHTNFSICLLVAATVMILMVAVNEMLQREGIVDYKKPLDFDTDIAHESGKLMGGKGERRNLYNNFAATLGNGTAPKQWNSSTEQIIMGGVGGSTKNYHNWWVLYMIFTKLQGLIAFYWIFVGFSVSYMAVLFGSSYVYSMYWFMVAGSLLGILAMLVLSPKIVFVIFSVLHTIGLILAVSFYSTNTGDVPTGVSLIIFYTFIGSSLVIPAINILELSSLNFNESFLAIGSIFELLGIALIQYFTMTEPAMIGNAENRQDVIAGHFIAMIVLSVILQVIVLWHMPNTYNKSLAEISSDLNRMTSYFAFSRMMVPMVTHHQDTTRTFAESVTSEQPEIEEKQLSTRNGHLATRYNDRSDESTGRRSPYNDFSETRYTRRTVVEREVSPIQDQDDPYLQEQLQRQHERNYILSRQQHYRQQSRESPESQQYNYQPQPERQPNLRQSRYIPEPEDYPPERPLSNASQHARYNPPLLSRHQYYEEYNQGSRQIQQQQLQQKQAPIPLPKPVPPRQSSNSPSDLQSQLSSVLRRSANPSATVKSEPGYVSRPRLQTHQSDAPAPPPMPPADYLTKSLPRIKPERQQSRESIHPVLIPKPPKPEEDIVPGVEYSHNLRPSEFLRQTRQSALYRVSAQPST